MNALQHLARRSGESTPGHGQSLIAPVVLVAGVLLLAACSASTPSAANTPDDEVPESDGPSAHFVLSITPAEEEGEGDADPDGDAESDRGDEEPDDDGYDWWAKSRVVLTCNPDDGTHPDPGRACLSLRSAGGDFEQLPIVPKGCPRIFAPVEVEAIGYWDDERVDYTETFSNRCEAATGTGSVFEL